MRLNRLRDLLVAIHKGLGRWFPNAIINGDQQYLEISVLQWTWVQDPFLELFERVSFKYLIFEYSQKETCRKRRLVSP